MGAVIEFQPKPRPLPPAPDGLAEYMEMFNWFAKPLCLSIHASGNPRWHTKTFIELLLTGLDRETASEVWREIGAALPGYYE